MARKTDRPVLANEKYSYIGRPPSSSQIGRPLHDQYHYTTNHLGHGQIVMYSAPDWTTEDNVVDNNVNPSYDYDFKTPTYPIILYSPQKTDTSNDARQLGGSIIPHCVVPYFDRAYGLVTEPARVTWEASFGSVGEQTIWQSDKTYPEKWIHEVNGYSTGGGVPSAAFDRRFVEPIELYNHTSPDLAWDGDCALSHLHFYLAGNDANLSKLTESPSGKRYIKVQRNGTNNPYAKFPQVPGSPEGFALRVGAKYRITAECASDGNATPVIKDAAGTTLATGTTSTSWQDLDDTFTMSGGGYVRLEATTSTGTEYVHFRNIRIQEIGKFVYDPESDGDMGVGYLRTYRMRVGALSIWSMPDEEFTADQAVWTDRAFEPGQAIRGYTGTGRPSLGDLERLSGLGDTGSLNSDDMERVTRRCFFQAIHPLGIGTTSTSYVNMRAGEASYFRITPRNLTNQTGSVDQTQQCGVVLTTNAASPGAAASVKFTALTSGDTLTISTESEVDMQLMQGQLDTRITGDCVKVELDAPSDGDTIVHNVAMWEGAWDDFS